MSALQAIADRVEIEALRGEAADAAMMLDYDRGASQFTPDGTVRIPHIGAELTGREEIRAGEVRYLDHSPLAGSAPPIAGNAGNPPTENKSSAER